MTAEIVNINTNKIPPKTFKVRHKGLHGTVTFDPDTKRWTWRAVIAVKLSQQGVENTEAKARETLTKILDTAATAGNNVSTTE